MANVTPIWSQWGYDSVRSQRSTISLPANLDDLTLYYYYDSGGATPITASYSASITVAKPDDLSDREYVYFGMNGYRAITAIQTNFNSPGSGAATFMWKQWLPSIAAASNYYVIPSCGIDLDGNSWVLASSGSAGAGLPALWQIDPLISGGVTGFTGASVVYPNYNNLYAPPVIHQNYLYVVGFTSGLVAQFHMLDPRYPSNNTIHSVSLGLPTVPHRTNGGIIMFDPNPELGIYYAYILCNYEYLYIDKINLSTFSVTSAAKFPATPGSNYTSSGSVFNASSRCIYISVSAAPGNAYGIYVYKSLGATISLGFATPYPVYASPSMALDGTIYVRAGKNLYALVDDGTGILTNKFDPITTLPDTTGSVHSAAPIVDGSGRIIVCSDMNGAQSYINIFADTGTGFASLKTISLPFPASVKTTPSIGSSGMLYVTTTNNYLLAYGTGSPPTPTTTTTTTTPTPGNSSSSSSTSSESSEEPPTTTTTTTTIAPLSTVQTTFYELVNDQFVASEVSNASDSADTTLTPFAKSFSFGTISPNETSGTMVIQLNVPKVQAIRNIKLGLVDIGDLTFTNTSFGINYSVELRDDITPDSYFQGVNTNKSSTSLYNISIPNKDDHTSDYVYLNIKLPSDYEFKTGMVKFKWFFDYA